MSRRHEHRFEEGEVVFEDISVFTSTRCRHAPVTNSWTDDARDETYYETGPQCEAVRRERWDIQTVLRDGNEVTYDETPELWKELVLDDDVIMELEQMVAARANHDRMGTAFEVAHASDLDGSMVKILVERANVEVDER